MRAGSQPVDQAPTPASALRGTMTTLITTRTSTINVVISPTAALLDSLFSIAYGVRSTPTVPIPHCPVSGLSVSLIFISPISTAKCPFRLRFPIIYDIYHRSLFFIAPPLRLLSPFHALRF
ncbi:eORF13 [Murid betaherpesvirus 8]|uniref:EORF13 n=1 Tax=Rat cytomegalovirus (isolate England) TaxID=1261657 RepID=K7XY62_RCMVE|nr:eORF13 [Murid betaherpesvirus 8]AFX83470.1 eORF13 [Murid betaherpesvirus 8]